MLNHNDLYKWSELTILYRGKLSRTIQLSPYKIVNLIDGYLFHIS